MARQFSLPRKQRTRRHVIADLSIHYVERFVLEEGHTAQQLVNDYGYDLLMFTYDDEGYVEPGFVSFQVKAAESLEQAGADYVFDLDIRDYNLWMVEKMPVVLVLFDVGRRRGYWLAVKDYFREAEVRQPRQDAKTVRLRVDGRQLMNRRAIAKMRSLKNRLFLRVRGAES